MKSDIFGAWIYATCICAIAVVTSFVITSCVEDIDIRETIEERAIRQHEWCQTYCQATGSILAEIRVQGGSTPTCVCLVPEPVSCNEASCDLEWD